MKWSLVAGLFFTAPLALAATLKADLVERNMGNSGMKCSGSSCSNGRSSGTIVVQEVVIIWSNNGGGSKTKTVNEASSVMGSVQATHTVMVGGSTLVYTPESISANIGDMVIFQFMSNNHTVTQSAFATPCDPLPGGIDSGFMPNINNTVVPPPQMAMQVNVSTPIWFFCGQKSHCGKGMTFSINPTANKTQAMFKQMAIAQKGTGTTAGIVAPAPATAAGSSVATPPPPPPATTTNASPPANTTAPPPANTAEVSQPTNTAIMVAGTGNTDGGSVCSCSCFCGIANFPSAAQGLGGFGGMSGSMPMSAALRS